MTTQPSTGPRPRTEAGRNVVALYDPDDWLAVADYVLAIEAEILAIEAEARAAALTAVEEAVRAEQGWPVYADEDGGASTTGNLIDRDRLLAVLAKLQEAETSHE